MANVFTGTGNIGKRPELRTVTVKGETKRVLDLRVFFDLYKRGSDGNPVQDDEASFWKNVTLWDARAEQAARHLVKGARIRVEGALRQQKWTDRETGEERIADSIVADAVYLAMTRIEEIRWKQKPEDSNGGESSTSLPEADADQ